MFFPHFVAIGLSEEGQFHSFLTDGLYDPRLLITIASFLPSLDYVFEIEAIQPTFPIEVLERAAKQRSEIQFLWRNFEDEKNIDFKKILFFPWNKVRSVLKSNRYLPESLDAFISSWMQANFSLLDILPLVENFIYFFPTYGDAAKFYQRYRPLFNNACAAPLRTAWITFLTQNVQGDFFGKKLDLTKINSLLPPMTDNEILEAIRVSKSGMIFCLFLPLPGKNESIWPRRLLTLEMVKSVLLKIPNGNFEEENPYYFLSQIEVLFSDFYSQLVYYLPLRYIPPHLWSYELLESNIHHLRYGCEEIFNLLPQHLKTSKVYEFFYQLDPLVLEFFPLEEWNLTRVRKCIEIPFGIVSDNIYAFAEKLFSYLDQGCLPDIETRKKELCSALILKYPSLLLHFQLDTVPLALCWQLLERRSDLFKEYERLFHPQRPSDEKQVIVNNTNEPQFHNSFRISEERRKAYHNMIGNIEHLLREWQEGDGVDKNFIAYYLWAKIHQQNYVTLSCMKLKFE